MLDKNDSGRFDSVEDLIAHLEWENLNLKIALDEARRDLKQAYGDNLKFAAALREVPKFMSMYIERP